MLPGRLGASRPDLFEAAGHDTLGFNEHVRATMTHFKGVHDLYVLPLAGSSDAELGGWLVRGPADVRDFEVVELQRYTLGGEKVMFDKKVPFELRIADASDVRVVQSSQMPLAVALVPAQTLTVSLTD